MGLTTQTFDSIDRICWRQGCQLTRAPVLEEVWSVPGPPVVVPAVPGLMSPVGEEPGVLAVPGVEVCVPVPVPVPMGVTGDGGGAAEPGLVPAGDAPAPDPPYTPVAAPVPLWASAALGNHTQSNLLP